MSDDHFAPGLTADWLNAWLAAIGVTVLVPGVRLSWTHDPLPKARFTSAHPEPLAESIALYLPSADELQKFVIADLKQNVPPGTYATAAAAARRCGDLTLGILTTDLGGDGKNGALPNGPFNVGAPRGETLFTRLRACRQAIADASNPIERVQATLEGRGVRHGINGLGFDYRRIAASVPGEAPKLVDPVVECLCFFGLVLHPMGGNGTRPRQRGWTSRPWERHAFRWPTWTPALDRWGIDALLDETYRHVTRQAANGVPAHKLITTRLRLLGITGIYGSVPFKPVGQSDPTRGYTSERLA